MKLSRIALTALAVTFVGSIIPQTALADYYRTYTYTRTETPAIVTQSPMIERVVESPAVIERVVEKPVMVERVIEKPVTVEKIVEKPVVIERRVEAPIVIDKTIRDDNLIKFGIFHLFNLGLF